MGRPSRPYYWAARDGWYATIAGTRHRLAAGKGAKAEATRAFHRLMAADGPGPRRDLAVAELFDLFLGHVAAHSSRGNFLQYRGKLQSFADVHGTRPVSGLRPSHMLAWLARSGWGAWTRRGAIAMVKAAFNWAIREGMIAGNPFASVRKPAVGKAKRTMTAAEAVMFREAAGDCFGDFLDGLRWTGSRPQELARLEAAHIDWDAACAVLDGKTTEATGEPIVLRLAGPMLALCRRLADRHPTGPLFVNARGRAWGNRAIAHRMAALRRKLGVERVTAYTYRHTYVTDALERGVPVTDVAALANHRSIQTTMGYAHLKERRIHLRRQAEKAIGV